MYYYHPYKVQADFLMSLLSRAYGRLDLTSASSFMIPISQLLPIKEKEKTIKNKERLVWSSTL